MKNLFTLILLFVGTNVVYAQNQIGNNIDGFFSDDRFGFSVNMPSSNHIIVGAPYGNSGSGYIVVKEWDGTSWNQKGASLNGDAIEDYFGWSVEMPDENTIAVGAYKSDENGTDAGSVKIYEWNGVDWIQKGNSIVGVSSSDICGTDISMPNANTIAVGSPGNDDNGSLTGHVRIFQWNGSAWTQKGLAITGENLFDQSGSSVSMPDENTLAIGARYNDDGGSSAGHVRIYQWDGSNWVQKGADLDGEAASDNFGIDVSMPNPNTLAVGAYNNDGNGAESGHVRVFSWTGSSWSQIGGDIDGQNAGDLSGFSLSMPASDMVAIGARYNSINGNLSGNARVLKWNGSQWNQLGNDIYGDAVGDNAGYAVTMPDASTIAVSAPFNDGNGDNAGTVKVFSLCTSTNSFISPEACDSYISPSGNYTWTTSGLFQDTISNVNGCDSIIAIDLTINSVDISVTNNSPNLIANANGANFQWLDCNNNFAIMSGETSQSFLASSNGSYAVEITQNGCTDTSACELINNVSISENSFVNELTLFPNPTSGQITIDLGTYYSNLNVVVKNAIGQEVQNNKYKEVKTLNMEIEGETGIYFIVVKTASVNRIIKIIKQ